MAEKIRVCILTPSHYSSHSGGSEYQAALLADALSRTNKYEIFYICQHADESYVPKGYQIRLLKNTPLPGSFFSFLGAKPIYDALNKIRPSIIYQRVGGIYTGASAYYAKKNAKLIWHISSDNDIIPYRPKNIKSYFRKIPERVFLNYGIKNAEVIVAQTKQQAVLLEKKFRIKTKNIISNGHPIPDQFYTKKSPVNILWIGNLKPLKRPEIFVQLARHFQKKDVKFTMIGRPSSGKWFVPLFKEIKKLPNLIFTGELSQNEVNEFLNRGHILVNTSMYEGFSNTFIQAWMRKVPVVSLTVDPDMILEKNKIGFRSGTFEQLCKDVNTLASDHLMMEQMGEKARIYARDNHSLENFCLKLLKLMKP